MTDKNTSDTPQVFSVAAPVTRIIVAGVALVAASPFLMQFLSDRESSGRPMLTVYADTLAGGLPTVCDGLTRHVTSTPIVIGDVWSEEKCLTETRAAVVRVQTRLASCFKQAPSQMVWDMATSHAWNLGVASTCGSLAMREWNAGHWADGCARMAKSLSGRPVWSYTCSWKEGHRECVFVQGLANRRALEAGYCSGDLRAAETLQ